MAIRSGIPRAWPAFVAVGVVAAMSAATLIIDVVVARETSTQTGHLVENSLRSIELADDLKLEAHRISETPDNPRELGAAAERIASAASEYAPLATEQGERIEFEHLLQLLTRLQNGGGRTLVPDIEDSIERLISINERAAHDYADQIVSSQDHTLIVDVVAGLVTITSALLIVAMLARSVRRQRELLQLHLAGLDQRQRDLEAFAARAAHDLRGPLSPLRGYSDLLQMDGSDRVREFGLRIRRASDRMNGIIDDLLALAVAGRPREGDANVREVIDTLVREFEVELRDASLDVRIPADIVVGCSFGVLSQMLQNILSNAVKYREPSRSLAVAITAERIGNYVSLSITDNGIGMDAETATHAFEPFFRAASSSAPGHGLGLSIIKRTVDALGGSITLTSTKNAGTTVTIKLPLA
jgi:signal transduction histidine kinase